MTVLKQRMPYFGHRKKSPAAGLLQPQKYEQAVNHAHDA
jgi:hypothetical protein